MAQHNPVPDPARGAQGAQPGRLDALTAAVRAAGWRGPAPVDKWNPPDCGDLDIRIRADGSWLYMGSPIGRQPLVRLFASVLAREGERYVLKTPAEKVGITVEDVPFLAVEMAVEEGDAGRTLVFRTNMDDLVRSGPGHDLRFARGAEPGDVVPYLHVRYGLEARLTRAAHLDLMEAGEVREVEGMAMFGVASAGHFYAILPASELEPGASGTVEETAAHAGRVDLATFVARARTRLAPEPPPFYTETAFPGVNGDHALQPKHLHLVPAAPPRHAAVLVPIVARAEPTVLLTLRAASLSNHAGQIAFPGGRVDSGDRDDLDAALREAREEVGLDSGLVEPLGYLDGYLSGTGFWIVPVVGLVDPGYRLTLNPREVDEAFEVPLSFLMAPANHQRHSREFRGTLRHFYAMPYGERYIWGATAGMLRMLYERVYA